MKYLAIGIVSLIGLVCAYIRDKNPKSDFIDIYCIGAVVGVLMCAVMLLGGCVELTVPRTARYDECRSQAYMAVNPQTGADYRSVNRLIGVCQGVR